MMKKINNLLLSFLCAIVLTACGGGGGGGGGGSTPPPSQNKTFTVGLESIEISRISNGDDIPVDATAVSSDTLTYSQD